MSQHVGAVAIGRNEGDRLRRCLTSLQALTPHVVYVDSGSTDGSVELAKSLGAHVVNLDTSQGFTAARARNAGWRHLVANYPTLRFIQFVDGDCEVSDGWLRRAYETLTANADLAIACGRRRERFPEQTVYNRLCDMEWNTPVGEADACGGDAMMRIESLQQVDGFNDRLIAGEEPEMCLRMRELDWKIQRLDAEMTLHDAAMTRFWQWFKRCERAGHAYAEWHAMHGHRPSRPGVRESHSILFWAAVWPLGIVLLSAWTAWAWLGLLAYPVMLLRIALRRKRDTQDPWSHCLLFGLSCMAAKWPQLWGQLRYRLNRLRGHQSTLIEYKT